jgi:hypothetical protein
MSGFPKPSINDVVKDTSVMVYVQPIENLGIGARPLGLPKNNVNGSRSIEHVGGTFGAKKMRGNDSADDPRGRGTGGRAKV